MDRILLTVAGQTLNICDNTAIDGRVSEYVPFLMYGSSIKNGVNLGTRETFSDVGATILDYFGIKKKIKGESMLREVKRC